MPQTPPRPAPEDEAWVASHEGSTAGGRSLGVLVLHGFTGSPCSVRPWAEHLHRKGFSVSVPRLPGHGTSWQDCNTTSYPDWYAEAERAFEKLQADVDDVFVAGLSMGGLLGFDLALAKGREVRGLALVNPAVATQRKDVRLLPVLKHVVPSFPAIGNDIKKPGVSERAYPRTPLRAADSLFRNMRRVCHRLPEVTQPLLVLRSEVDHVVDPSSGRAIMTTVSSRDLEEVVLGNSYHVATLDHDAETVFRRSEAFFRRLAEVADPAGGALS